MDFKDFLRSIISTSKSKPNIKDPDEIKREKAHLLLKEATALRDTDIELAIKKIREAINLGHRDYAKLSNYLYLAGRFDEAVAIYTEIKIPEAKSTQLPHNSLCGSFNGLASLYYKRGKFEEYFYYSSLATYFSITHSYTYVAGGESLLESLYKIRKPIYYTEKTNFDKALKKIGKLDIYDEYEETFMKLFDELREKIYAALKTNCFFKGITAKTEQKFLFFTEELFNSYYYKNLYPLLFN